MSRSTSRRSLGTLVISLLVATFNIDPASAQGGQASCPSGFAYIASVNGCYQLILQKQTWQNSTQTCASLAPGAHLAFIDSVNEDKAVSSYAVGAGAGSCVSTYFGLGAEWWLGAQRIDPSYKSDFYWKTSESGGPVGGLEYSNWNPGQPDNIDKGEACMTFIPAWANRWNDAPCITQTFCAVCELDVPVPTGQYCILVYTSDLALADTKAKVYITLHGNTDSSEYNLYDSSVDSFAQGQTSKFCLSIPSVGPLKRITIRHDNSGGAPGWFLDKVVVQEAGNSYTFPAYRWLAVDDLDKAISVDLTQGRPNLAYLKPTWQSSTWVAWGSSRAVDGNKDRIRGDLASCSSTQFDSNAWWVVDLGKPAFVDGVQITTRAIDGGFYDSKMIIGLTNSPPTLVTPVPVPANYYICNSGPLISNLAEYIYVMCQPAANQPSTRYVVVQLNQTTNYLTLCEVEVFGNFDTSPCSTNPCHNGGTCVSSADRQSYTCSCVPGYAGATCTTPACPDGFTYFSGVNGCYQLMITDQTWSTSAALCASMAPGAHLAFVSSDLEQKAISTLIAEYYKIKSSYTGVEFSCIGTNYFGLGPEWWLGSQRIDPASNTAFNWKRSPTNVTGPLVYTNWNPGQPDYCCGGESCMTIITNWAYKWNDAPCDAQTFCGVCEFDMPNNPSVNLALKQPTTQSTVYATWDSTRGVDGNKFSIADQGSCFATTYEANAWWAVDLGAPARVQGVQLATRECCVEQSANVYIGLTNIPPSTSTPPQYPNYDLCARGPQTTVISTIYTVQCASNLPSSRYVVLQVDGPQYMSFCEVEVYGVTETGPCANMPCQNGGTCSTVGSSYTCACALGWTGPTCTTAATNLAQSRPAVQSSTWLNWAADRAVDGNTNTNANLGSCSTTSGDVNPWWAVDLGTPTFVQGVKLVNRGDAVPERENGFIVGLTNMNPSARPPHPTSYTVGFCGQGPANTLLGQSYWVRCGQGLASARYVVIQVETQTWLAICELYVYGQQDTGPCSTSPCANGGKCQSSGSSYKCTCAVGWSGSNCSTAAVNLALNRPAWQSSTYATTWTAGLATDGSRLTAGGKCAGTNSDWSAWWAVDLGAPVFVQGVLMVNRGDCCGNLDNHFVVGLTNTPPTQNVPDPTNYVTCGYGPNMTDVNANYYISCFANQAAARFVVVQLPTTVTNFLVICELEVYGTPDTSACSANPCRNGGTCIPSGSSYTCRCFAGWTGSTCSTAALNIAIGRPTVQSSTYGLWVSSRAVDGNRDPTAVDLGSCTSTLAEVHPWWSVDLGQPTYVQGVLYVVSTLQYVGDPMWNVIIGLTNISPAMREPTPGGYVVCGYSITAQYAKTQNYIMCAPNLEPSRYVTVQFEKTDFLRVCELEVYSSLGPCGSNPCQNGGDCTNSGVGFSCSCPAGFTGNDCSTKVNPCASLPCANGGQCVSSSTAYAYTCNCATGWTGANCQTKVDPCASAPCANGGQCTSSSSGYTCACATGWTGTNCQTKVDPCASTPCANGGQCTSSSSGYTCTCATGWTGTNCQTKVDPCASSPCANGGQCTSGSSGYTCTCSSLWTGPNCQTKVDPCATTPCANGGACTATGATTYTCTCKAGWVGTNCKTIDYCASAPCKNGGNCTVLSGSYACSCKPGFAGVNCQMDTTACAAVSATSKINCGWGGVTSDQCNARSCCFDAQPPAGAAACFHNAADCLTINLLDRVDCRGNTTYMSSIICTGRGCCYDSSTTNKGPVCYRQAAQAKCLGVTVDRRVSQGTDRTMPNECEAKGFCWDSSVADSKLWCFSIKP